jgi:diguanylate cyclase (GGDEF)-like protein
VGPTSEAGFAHAVLDALPDATAVLDPAGTIVAVNHIWRMFSTDNGGDARATGVGASYLEVCERSAVAGCHDAQEAADGLLSVLSGERVQCELEYPCPSPTVDRWFLLRATWLGGNEPGAVVAHVNITRRKMAEHVLAGQAAHDPLTGLANGSLLTVRLGEALVVRAGRPPAPGVGLLCVGLDGLEQVNDTFGQYAVYEVLLTTAHRLRRLVRPEDTVARVEDDEFVLVVPPITARGLASLTVRIEDALNEPHRVHGHVVEVPASVGSHLAAAGEPVEEALVRAHEALEALRRARPSCCATDHSRRRRGRARRPGPAHGSAGEVVQLKVTSFTKMCPIAVG